MNRPHFLTLTLLIVAILLTIPIVAQATSPLPSILHPSSFILHNFPASPCINGFAAGTYPCQGVDLLAHLPLNEIGGGEGADIWGWTDPQTSHEYALVTRSTGTSHSRATR